MAFLLLVLLPLFSFAQSVSVVNKQIILKGKSCQLLRAEVAQMWRARSSAVTCTCQTGTCKINLTEIVPVKIRDLALKSELNHSGPNCWNSVLFLNGLAPGLQYSDEEVEFWFNSPLCELVSPGEPKPGDIFNFTRKGLSGHTMRMLSPNLIFNKESPIKLDHYEILNLADYLKSKKMEPQCQNVRPSDIPSLNCKGLDEYSIYRCKSFEDYVAGELPEGASEAKKKLKAASDCITAHVMGRSMSKTQLQIYDIANVINKLASDQLKLPTLDTLPPELIAEWKRTQRGEMFPEEVAQYCMLAQSDMDVSHHAKVTRERVELFRRHKAYDYTPTKDYLIWSQIFLASKGLKMQYEEFEAH